MNNLLVSKVKRNHFLARKGVLALLACFLALLFVPALGTAQITCPITNNSYDDNSPHINKNGYVVWRENDGTDLEIFLYNGTTTTQLTNNSYYDDIPQINDNGYVVWYGWDGSDYEIFLYNGTSTIQLTNNTYDDMYPQINNNGYVVWEGDVGPAGEIFLYNGTSTTNISNSSYHDTAPQINNNGYVVWQGFDGTDWEILLYDGSTTTNLSNNSYNDYTPQINNNGYVIWQEWDGTDTEIFLYNGTTTTQLTNNAYNDNFPQINNNGYVVWQGVTAPLPVAPTDIFLYNGSSITNLTNDANLDTNPQINDNNTVVWEKSTVGGIEIYLYDGTTTTQITNNTFPDANPQINNNGYVVWSGGDGADLEIFLYSSPSTTQITNNSDNDGVPEINDNGYVVWQQGDDGSPYEIFLYNGTAITQLTNNSDSDLYPQINDNGYVVWQGSYGSQGEIFLYDGTTTTQLTNISYDDHTPQINNNGYVVWYGSDGSDNEIFLYNGTTTIQLTNNSYGDDGPQINDNGYVVWQGSDGSDFEIFLYDGTTTSQITNNSDNDYAPRINNNGYVVWEYFDGSDMEIFYYDGTSITQITNNAQTDLYPHINNNGYVVWRGYDGSDYEIFLYVPAAPCGSPPLPTSLISPFDGETNVALNPAFTWNASAGADSYGLQVATDLNFANLVVDQVGITVTSYTLTSPLSKDVTYYWQVNATNGSGESGWSDVWSFHTQQIYGNPFADLKGKLDPDSDGDGLDDCLHENRDCTQCANLTPPVACNHLFNTDYNKKTLFIRPKEQTGTGYKYWEKFVQLFPDSRGSGYADIPPFTHAGIEIVVIGCPLSNPNCHTYAPFNNFNYDPVTDSSHPPCDILDVVYKLPTSYYGNSPYKGHTYFKEVVISENPLEVKPYWWWDTKGLTPNIPNTSGYFIPELYSFPLENYFTEGAYTSIGQGASPVTTDCSKVTCNLSSPVNLAPFDTVEFNPITFNTINPYGQITEIGQTPAKGYTRDDVLKRTTVHEIGHALLNASNDEHCKNTQCIMYESVMDWELYDFGSYDVSGAPRCFHVSGGSRDIRQRVHNTQHLPAPPPPGNPVIGSIIPYISPLPEQTDPLVKTKEVRLCTITINGTNFGSAPGKVKFWNLTHSAGPAVTPLSWSDTQIKVKVPAFGDPSTFTAKGKKKDVQVIPPGTGAPRSNFYRIAVIAGTCP